jgi:hypothetical protein
MVGMKIQPIEKYDEAIDSVKRRVPMPREEWDALGTAERENAFTVSEVTEIRVLQQVLDGVERAVEDGTTLDDFKDSISADLVESWGGEIPGRLENIFRTNVLESYAQGREAVMSAPAVREARPYCRFDDVSSDRECDECADCGGTVLPADDPWWEGHSPLLHHQCMCHKTPLSLEEAEEEGIDDVGPDVQLDDEDFGGIPSAIGKDWEPDLSAFDPELRSALEERLRR